MRDPDSSKYVGSTEPMGPRRSGVPKSRRKIARCSVLIEPGEAAFYGPKIDFVVKDVHRPRVAARTVQVDYQLPQALRPQLHRPDTSRTGRSSSTARRSQHGAFHRRADRALSPARSRLWLAPVQVPVLSISEKFNDYASKGFGATKDRRSSRRIQLSGEKIGAKIAPRPSEKIPYMLIVGEKEVAVQRGRRPTRTAATKARCPSNRSSTLPGKRNRPADTRSRAAMRPLFLRPLPATGTGEGLHAAATCRLDDLVAWQGR